MLNLISSALILGTISIAPLAINAYTTTLNSTALPPSNGFIPPTAAITGPQTLSQVFPLKLYLGAGNAPGAGQYSETTDIQNSMHYPASFGGLSYNLQSQSNNKIRSYATIYLIYYTNGQISGTRQSLIQNFVTNIGSTNYWKKVQQYVYNGYTPAAPIYTNSVTVSPSSTSFGTSMQKQDSENLLLYVFRSVNSGFKDSNGIYMIILGTDISFTYNSNVMGKGSGGGQDIYCGIHDVYKCRTSMGNGCQISGDIDYYYSVVGMPKSPSTGDKCNIFPFITPNGDSSLDNTINFMAHELVEAIISYPYAPLNDNCGNYNSCNGAWTDSFSLQAMDKCSNIVTNLVPTGSTSCGWGATQFTSIPYGTSMTQAFYNLVVNGQRYVVQPVWSNQDNSCSMGGGSTPTNYQTGSSLNQFCSYCSSGGNTGLYSIPPSGQLGRLTSGSNWAAGSSTIFSSTNHNGLCMQTDGNICAKTNNLASQIWCSNTGGSNNGPFNLAMQPDGNLVAYDKNGNSLWASGTGGRSNDNYCTAMQADQNIVIYDSSCNVVWHLK